MSIISRLRLGFFGLLILALVISTTSVQASEEAFTGDNDITGFITEGIPITELQITGVGDDVLNINIHAEHGTLEVDTTTGLTFESNNPDQTLQFSGTRSNINVALETLEYSAYKLGTFTIEVTIGGADGEAYNSENGHIYQVVGADGEGISWIDANIAAEAMTYEGIDGYLATITSETENDFIQSRLSENGWIGASDTISESDWKWVSGPETGTSFWSGWGHGAPVGEAYANWNSDEPNDSGDDEDCAEFRGADEGGWNDLPCNSVLQTYVVEFGTDEDAPAVVNTQFEVTVEGPSVEAASCEELQSIDDDGGSWYATITLTNDIDCEGQTIDSLFTEEPFQGTFDGGNYTISNFVIDQSDEYVGLISEIAGNVTIRDLNLESAKVTALSKAGALLGGGSGGFTINNVHASDVDIITTEDGYAGGLIGDLDNEDGIESSISNVSVEGTVTASGEWSSNIGGLIGMAEAQSSELIIEKAYADVDVTNTVTNEEMESTSDVGGLIGEIEADNDYSGGDYASVTVRNSYAWGSVNAPESENVGGLIGRVDVEYYPGYDIETSIQIEKSYARGAVTGLSDVGGLIGQIDGPDEAEEDIYYELNNTFAMGQVTELDENEETGVGGLVGYLEGNASDLIDSNQNYFDEARTTQDVCNSIIEMDGCVVVNIAANPQPDYFINNTTNHPLSSWDFEDIWVMNEEVPPTFKTYVLGDDFNGDGIEDEEQPNIGSYINQQTGKRIVIDVGEECELTVDDMTTEANLPIQDSNYIYEYGLFDFAGDCGEPGFSTTVSLYYYGVNPDGTIFRKFNPNTNTFGTVEEASISAQTINGESVAVVTYQITDGQELDTDQEVNGEFEDPAGLATLSSNTPSDLANTGQDISVLQVIGSILVLLGFGLSQKIYSKGLINRN